jgi:hypothetical protein
MPIDPLETLGKAAKYFLITLAILYASDWSVFEARQARGTAMGSVPVEQYLQTPLKGNKAEYDYMGTADQTCSRTLFPQYASSQWNVPCWWLARHKAQWQ